MDNYEKQFEQIADGLNIDDRPNAEHKKTLRQQTLTAHKDSLSKTTAPRIQPVWSRIMKSNITKSAAAVIIITGVLYFCVMDGTVTAAEKLKEVIESNTGYKGWLHITYNTPPKNVPEGDTLINQRILHINTADGTMIIEGLKGGEQIIKYYSPPTKEYIEYSSLKGRVFIYDLGSFSAKRLAETYPLTIDAIITLFEENTKKGLYQISISQDEGYERFDIKLFENKEEADRVAKETNSVFPLDATIWVDIDTNLICKWKCDTISASIKYGEPFIEDIYDLGVPQNVMITDYRNDLNTEAILNRLKKRMENLNHYVAIMTETPLNNDGTYNKEMCAVHLFAQSNNTWLANRYLIGAGSYASGKSRQSIMETPESWPSVEIKSMLEKIKDKQPSEFYVYNGENLCSQFPVMPKVVSAESKKATIDRIKIQFGLAGKIWFGNWHQGPGTKIEVVSRDGNPNQIGLKIEFESYVKSSVKQQHEEYYWFDPERDDMPTERISRDFSPGRQAIENEFSTVYLDYSKRLDGRWYPTKWRITTISNFQGGRSNKYTREYHLYLNDDMELEKDWFTSPLERSKD